MFAELAAEAERQAWPVTTELAAAQVEVTHALLRAVLTLAGGKGTHVPKPLAIPRPQQQADPEHVIASPREAFAVLMRARRS